MGELFIPETLLEQVSFVEELSAEIIICIHRLQSNSKILHVVSDPIEHRPPFSLLRIPLILDDVEVW